jgi:hypothetical protein
MNPYMAEMAAAKIETDKQTIAELNHSIGNNCVLVHARSLRSRNVYCNA